MEYNTKIIIAGDIITRIHYAKNQICDQPPTTKTTRVGISEKVSREHKPREVRQQTIIRARSQLINSIHANAGQYLNAAGKKYTPKMITLTYSEPREDVTTCNKEARLFIKRLNYYCHIHNQPPNKYHIVPEKTRKGKIHYHLVVYNMEFIPIEDLKTCWGLGGVHIKRINNIGKTAVYLTKGFTAQEDLVGKRYWGSRGLIKPKEFKGMDLQLPDEVLKKQVYCKDYYNEYRGTITYIRYDLKKRTVNIQEFQTISPEKEPQPASVQSEIQQDHKQYHYNPSIVRTVVVAENKYRKLILQRSRHGP